MTEPVRALSGLAADEVTVDSVRSGRLGPDDLRIHPDTLERQARVAESHGNPQLAENLRRAAEMTGLDDDEVMDIYESLRPHRSSRAELEGRAAELESRGLRRCAALLREAAAVYDRRGLAG